MVEKIKNVNLVKELLKRLSLTKDQLFTAKIAKSNYELSSFAIRADSTTG